MRRFVVALMLVGTAAHADPDPRVSRAKKIADDARETAATRRSFGWFLVGSGIGMGALSLGFVWLSSHNNSSISDGQSTGNDYLDVATRGQQFNDAAWAFALVGAASIAVGVPLILRNGDLAIVPASPGGGVGVALAGRL